MDDSDSNPTKKTIDIKDENVGTDFNDFPTADEADKGPSAVDAGEPEPFDPYKDTETEKTEPEEPSISPTPESVAADLKTATTEGVEYGPDASEEVSEPAKTPEPEEKVEAPKPQIIEDNSSKRFIIILVVIGVLIAGLIVGALFLLPAITGGSFDILGGLSGKRNIAEDDGSAIVRPQEKIDTYNDIAGVWQSQAEDGSCYVFTPIKTFYWAKSCDDFYDNYYYGDVSFKSGQEALNELDISYDRVIEMTAMSGGTVTKDDVYSLKLSPSELISDGVDKSDTASEMSLLFIRTGSDTAQGYSYMTGGTYYFAKRVDVLVPTKTKCGHTYFDFENYSNNDIKGCSGSDELGE